MIQQTNPRTLTTYELPRSDQKLSVKLVINDETRQ